MSPGPLYDQFSGTANKTGRTHSVAGLSVAAAATGDAGRDALWLSEELPEAFFDVNGRS